MLEIKAFRGFRFNPAVTGNLDNVITPPYDVITAEERAELAARSPWNMVHVILPKPGPDGGSPYDHAAAVLQDWIAKGGLCQDDEPSFYLLRQQFTDLEGIAHTRRAFFAATRLPESNERHILGHERTFDKPVADRYALTAATQMSLGAVFALYSDPERKLAAFLSQMEMRPADLVAHTFEGVQQELWRVPADPEVCAFFPGKTLYIADGHHRFRTACTYRDDMRKKLGNPAGPQPWDFALMGFVAFEDAGLRIYAAHRVVKPYAGFDFDAFMTGLGAWFDVTPAEGDLHALVKSDPEDGVFGLSVHGRGQYLVRFQGNREALLGEDRGPSWRALDVALLHRGIFERILGMPEGAEYIYEKSPSGALKAVADGSALMAFILKPTRSEQICACAEAGEPMPEKSTYFFPKLCTGGVLYPLYEP